MIRLINDFEQDLSQRYKGTEDIFIDLQWFAPEDEGKTEDPTEHKIRKEREEGRVAKSQELVGAMGLLFPALIIVILSGYILRTCVEMFRFFFSRVSELHITNSIVPGVFIQYYLRLAVPFLLVAVVAALFSNIAQVGFLFATKPLVPDFTKVVPNFSRYLEKTLFSMQALFNLVKSIAKIAIFGVVAYTLIRSNIHRLANLQTMELWRGFTMVAGLAAQLLIISAILLLLLSIPDMFFQRWQFKQNIKMTRQEVKEERKMYEGDPQIRGRIQRRMREFMSRNMAVNVAKADVVITNPTHFSIALEYNETTMIAPVLSAKGADELAFRIRSIAKENDVPIIENKPLARALYAEVDVGDMVPLVYYEAIARILAQVRLLDAQRRNVDGIGA